LLVSDLTNAVYNPYQLPRIR